MKQNAFKLNENFIKNYDEDIHKGYMLEADVKYPELYKLHNDLTFLPERMKIKKCQKLVSNQKAWLKSYTDINTKLRTEVKNSFEKYFFKLMNNAVFGKTMENVREKGDIKLVTKNKRRNYLVLELNYNTTKWFSENLQAIEVKKIKAKMNKPVYLGLSIPEICKTLIMSFGMIILNQSMQNSTICIQTALLYIMKLKMFIKTLQMMLKKDFIHQIMKLKDHYQEIKIKK